MERTASTREAQTEEFQRNPNSDRSISPLLSNLIHGPMTMSSSSSLHFPQILDDRDLDDAELWAVIDSATASRSSRKTPLLALTSSSHSPAPKPFRRPRNEIEASPRVSADGEVVQFQEERWPCRRPQKAARLADPIGDRQMVVVRHPQRPPVVTPPSPASSYASPVPERHVVKPVSPVVESPPPPPTFGSWNGGEKENQRHSLSGMFPSESLFKQYQNTAASLVSFARDKERYGKLSIEEDDVGPLLGEIGF